MDWKHRDGMVATHQWESRDQCGYRSSRPVNLHDIKPGRPLLTSPWMTAQAVRAERGTSAGTCRINFLILPVILIIPKSAGSN